MKLNLNFNLKDLEGNVIENANAGKSIANALASDSKGDALKFWDWATKLQKGVELDLDLSDAETLKNFVKNNEGFTNLFKGQVLPLFK